jgi:UDP-GlcNAc:undecaprenyl-phosphate/decaprenyl-phosphate GlcNAc-1-phosphate transferase
VTIGSYIPAFLLVFLVAAITAAVMTPVARWLGSRLGWVDRPGGRRKHRGIISRLGGMAMYAGFTVGVLATLLLPQEWFPPRLDPEEWFRLTGLLIGTMAAFVFGLLDDKFQFPSRPQYIAQFLLSLIAVVFIIFIERINDPFGSGQIVFPWPVVWGLTIFWFMGMINTVNWLDGLDGLAAGVSAILAAFLIIHMIREGQFSVALLPVALLGAVLGFLPFNFNPARIFMGSAGSYFLGWALAALAIIGGAKVATVLLVMSLPILDVAWLMYDRWRRGDRPGTGGRDHLHYRLLDIGFTQRQIVLGYYAFCATCGALALGLGSRLFKLVALLVLAAAVLAVLAWVSRQPVRKDSKGSEKRGE